jgi:hypothetical protein
MEQILLGSSRKRRQMPTKNSNVGCRFALFTRAEMSSCPTGHIRRGDWRIRVRLCGTHERGVGQDARRQARRRSFRLEGVPEASGSTRAMSWYPTALIWSRLSRPQQGQSTVPLPLLLDGRLRKDAKHRITMPSMARASQRHAGPLRRCLEAGLGPISSSNPVLTIIVDGVVREAQSGKIKLQVRRADGRTAVGPHSAFACDGRSTAGSSAAFAWATAPHREPADRAIIHHRRVLRSAKWHLMDSGRSALLDILDSCPCTHEPIERGKDLACASEPKCPADCAPCFRSASLRQSKPQRPVLRLGLHTRARYRALPLMALHELLLFRFPDAPLRLASSCTHARRDGRYSYCQRTTSGYVASGHIRVWAGLHSQAYKSRLLPLAPAPHPPSVLRP